MVKKSLTGFFTVFAVGIATLTFSGSPNDPTAGLGSGSGQGTTVSPPSTAGSKQSSPVIAPGTDPGGTGFSSGTMAGDAKASDAKEGDKKRDPSGAHIVRGEVAKIDGQELILRDGASKEIRMQLDKDTKMHGVINMGNQVEAKVLPSGKVLSLKQVSK